MNDKELLELAAKAAGIPTIGKYTADGLFFDEGDRAGCEMGWWNPLTDDRDALRLAVKLKIDIHYREVVWAQLAGDGIQVREEYKDDPYAATRRAIVRAAAEIGRSMK